MEIRFDHLVVAARELAVGVAWVESRLGVPMGAGGRHDVMGTHNRLLSLGPGRFLEVIAIDPMRRLRCVRAGSSWTDPRCARAWNRGRRW
jgi:hypothetical protein